MSDRHFQPPSEAVESAAAEWLVRHDRGITPEQQDEFLQWLAASPAHRESFQRHRQMWSEFNLLARWRPQHSAEPNPDLLASPRRGRLVTRWAAPALLAAAAALAVIFWRSSPASDQAGESIAYEAASVQQETLPDTSTIDLNRGAHAVVQYSPTERRVLLVHGEAQFTVAKHHRRPFVVRAAGIEVRAVGTSFHVKLTGAAVEVLVTEGSVQIQHPIAGRERRSAESATLAEMSAGQRTIIPLAPVPAPPVVMAASAEEINRLLDWKPRLLDFDSTPLAEVVETFNRRNRARLVIGDEALGGLPIVASIRSDNVDGFVRMLEVTMGIRAERRPGGEIVLFRAR